MKFIYSTLIFFTLFSIQSQNDLNIGFEKKVNPELSIKNLNNNQLSYIRFLKKNLYKFKYNLKIDLDNQISVFSSNYQMSVDGQDRTDRQILNTLNGRYPIYTSIKKDSIFELSNPLNNISFFTRFHINSHNWQLFDSTKVINGLRCKLAKGKLAQENPFLNSKNEIEYFAWYSPELPSKYGPSFFTGLPGLVVLAGYDFLIYEIKDIKKDNITLKLPKSKSINEKELIIKLKEAMMNTKN